MNHRGIPTVYRGFRMRSRTEARFAAFFDELKWDWDYEPLDLSGYIPDFLLHFERPLLVETKASQDEVPEAIEKIRLSGWTGESLIMSRAPGVLYADCYRIGDMLRPDGPGGEIVSGKAWLGTCLSCGQPIVHCLDWSSACRLCGADHDGLGHIGDFDPMPAWASATNRVQWRAA